MLRTFFQMLLFAILLIVGFTVLSLFLALLFKVIILVIAASIAYYIYRKARWNFQR